MCCPVSGGGANFLGSPRLLIVATSQLWDQFHLLVQPKGRIGRASANDCPYDSLVQSCRGALAVGWSEQS